MIEVFTDEYFMKQAFREAELAFADDEVPVGAVVVSKNKIIARAHNLTERLNDVTAHAEMLAITAASNFLGSKYLPQCTLYVTLEPCSMCAGALFWSKIGKVVVGAIDEKRGFQNFGGQLHPKTELAFGLMEKESSNLMISYFKAKRKL